jgi:hypothetical protein
VEDYAYKTLTPDVVSSFVGESASSAILSRMVSRSSTCRPSFESPQYFDVCLRLRERPFFQQFGFAFRHAMTFIEEVVYRSDETVKSEGPDPKDN